MDRPECAIKGCKNGALLLYGGMWICGECYMKVHNKRLLAQQKELNELGVEE